MYFVCICVVDFVWLSDVILPLHLDHGLCSGLLVVPLTFFASVVMPCLFCCSCTHRLQVVVLRCLFVEKLRRRWQEFVVLVTWKIVELVHLLSEGAAFELTLLFSVMGAEMNRHFLCN